MMNATGILHYCYQFITNIYIWYNVIVSQGQK